MFVSKYVVKLMCIFFCSLFKLSRAAIGETCTRSDITGKQTFINDCDFLYNRILMRPLTEADKSFVRAYTIGRKNGKLVVCCPEQTFPTLKNTNQPVQNSQFQLPNISQCGQNTQDKVFGGSVARIDEFPWMALLAYKKFGGIIGYHCGGVLISSRHVLTAAHCVHKLPNNWKLEYVRLGEYDIDTERDCVHGLCGDPVQDIQVESVIVHNKYNPDSKSTPNDIALLRLNRDVVFTAFLQPICLPHLNPRISDNTYLEYQLTVAGWGKTETASKSNKLLKLKIPMKENSYCDEKYRKLDVYLTDKQLCAGGNSGQDTCNGDSGGPLMLLEFNEKRSANWYVLGIVSFGPSSCGTEGMAGIYTRVDRYNDWILKNAV